MHLTPQDIAQSIKESWSIFIQGEMGQSPMKREHIYASGYSPCTRRLTLDMTHGDKLEPFGPEVLARFRRGNDRERDLMADLAKVGRNAKPSFTVIGQQERLELKDRKGRKAITAKIDGRLDFGNNVKPPIETKSWSPNVTARINTFEDLFSSPWTIRGAHQLLVYLLGTGEEYGFLLLDKPSLPDLIPVVLEPYLDMTEAFLTAAEEAIDHKEADTLPGFIDDPEECRRCPHFGLNCNPPIEHSGAGVETDPEIEANLDRMEELREGSKEYDLLNKKIKARYRGIEQVLVGKYIASGKWVKSTRYEVPEEVIKQIISLREPHKKVDPKGKFFLNISRL